MPQVTRLRVVGAAIAAGALTLGSLATATAAQAANPRRAIAHTHPAWAVPAKRLSQAATAGTVNARVYLAPNNAGQAGQRCRRRLHPGQQQLPALHERLGGPHGVRAVRSRGRFRQVLADLGRAERDQCQRQGPGRRVHRGARGIAGRRQQGVRRDVRHVPRSGRPQLRAPSQAATAPASVASSVLAVSGLDTAKSQIKPALPKPGPNYWVAKPCSTYYGQKIATNKPKAYGQYQP